MAASTCPLSRSAVTVRAVQLLLRCWLAVYRGPGPPLPEVGTAGQLVGGVEFRVVAPAPGGRDVCGEVPSRAEAGEADARGVEAVVRRVPPDDACGKRTTADKGAAAGARRRVRCGPVWGGVWGEGDAPRRRALTPAAVRSQSAPPVLTNAGSDIAPHEPTLPVSPPSRANALPGTLQEMSRFAAARAHGALRVLQGRPPVRHVLHRRPRGHAVLQDESGDAEAVVHPRDVKPFLAPC